MTSIGSRLAPPRFLLFAGALVLGVGGLMPMLGRARGAMLGFDGAALLFLLSVAPLLRVREVSAIRAAARRNDANRAALLVITGAVTLAVLAAVYAEVRGRAVPGQAVTVIATLVLAWLFSNTVYALHYAHLYYSEATGGGGDARGLDFPGTDEPDYSDFLYFSVTLGMTFQTSDVTIRARPVRRAVTGQSLAAFAFNLGVIAFTVNVLGGG